MLKVITTVQTHEDMGKLFSKPKTTKYTFRLLCVSYLQLLQPMSGYFLYVVVGDVQILCALWQLRDLVQASVLTHDGGQVVETLADRGAEVRRPHPEAQRGQRHGCQHGGSG